MDCACCVYVAKAAKYGALQGFLGGAGGGVYRGKSVIYLLFITAHKQTNKQTEKWKRVLKDVFPLILTEGGVAGCQGKYCGRRK